MNYPDDFNVPTFAAGKSIAVSRVMGIGILSGMLIIIFLCGLLLWTIRSVHVEPYILATGGINDEWKIIAPGTFRPEIKMTSNQIMQQSVVWKFAQNWFSISGEHDINANMWDTTCDRTDCDTTDGTNPCVIFCASGDNLFTRFKDDILPQYTDMAGAGTQWSVVVDSVRITPVGTITNAGGTWRVQLSVATSGNDTMHILAYAKVAQSPKLYPKTAGYYVADFNAYRVN